MKTWDGSEEWDSRDDSYTSGQASIAVFVVSLVLFASAAFAFVVAFAGLWGWTR